MNRLQVAAHVTRHREPVNGLVVLAVAATVGLALSPLIAGMALCLGWWR